MERLKDDAADGENERLDERKGAVFMASKWSTERISSMILGTPPA